VNKVAKMAAEHLYAHFFGPGHKCLDNVRVIIIDKTKIGKPAQRVAFWVHKLDTFVPRGLHLGLKIIIYNYTVTYLFKVCSIVWSHAILENG
jgi:hypothetical protein